MSESSSERPAGGFFTRRRAAGAIPTGLADASPTWELELLLSGAVLVALFQLSGLVDRAFDRVIPHVGEGGFVVLFSGYLYGKGMVLALVATFVLHLAARGYWVGLVGLHSVFPQGVKWDQATLGPRTRDVARERLPALPTLISRLDNFCSTLFSFGFLLVIFFAFSLVGATVIFGLAYVISAAFLGGRRLFVVLWVLIGALFALSSLPQILDRLFGARLDPQSPGGRALVRLARIYYWVSGLSVFGPTMLTLQTNTRRRAFSAVFYAALVGIMVYVTFRVVTRRADVEINSYLFFAQPAGHSVRSHHYESQRPRGEALPVTPTIQADVIRDPFIKLFIPFIPERHNSAIAARCPGVRPLRRAGLLLGERADEAVSDSAAAAVLRCAGQLHPVTLNGTPLTDLEFRFYEHPGNALRGMITYIPAAGLPRGLNVLTVQRAPRPEGSGRPDPPHPYIIPFWM